jgi:predicted amidohydrolase
VDAAELWDLVAGVPGPITEPIQTAARESGAHVVFGTYARGPERGIVYNTAVVIGPTGDILAVYRKTHPFGPERADCGGWVTPGHDAVVVDAPFARLGLMICFDGDYPELARIEAVQGAEVLCRPSALLRSADIWELTTRARAYDNHVFVVAANATGTDAGGAFYFGNSLIVTPIADVVARAASHECWVSARLDPSGALDALTPGSSVAQPFDHLADRNLALLRRHAAELVGPAASTFRQP